MPLASHRLRQRRILRKAWFVAVLAASLALRMFRIGSAPAPIATADEFHYLWAGISLWEHGVPLAWSDLEAYHSTEHWLGHVQMRDIQPQIVSPALDHPPFYSLVAGAYAKLIGAKPYRVTTTTGKSVELWEIDLARARILSLLLFSISFLLVYDLAARRMGFGAAIVSLIFFGSFEHAVLHNRLLVTESLSTPIFLASLCAYERLRTGRWSERTFGTVTVLLCAAALLTKVVAACQTGAIVILLLASGRRRAAAYPFIGLVLGLAIYMAYAQWQGWDFFWQVMMSQGFRFLGFNALQEIITHSHIVHTDSFDQPVIIGWIVLFVAAFGPKGWRGRELFIAPLVYFLQFVFFADVHAIYGWHLMPFFPFLGMALGALFMQAWRRANPLTTLALAALMAPIAFQGLLAVFPGASPRLRLIYVGVASLTILLPYVAGIPARRLFRFLLAIMLAGIVAGECAALYHDAEPAVYKLAAQRISASPANGSAK